MLTTTKRRSKPREAFRGMVRSAPHRSARIRSRRPTLGASQIEPHRVQAGVFVVRKQPQLIPSDQVSANAVPRQLDGASEQRAHHHADRDGMVHDQLHVTIAGRLTALIAQLGPVDRIEPAMLGDDRHDDSMSQSRRERKQKSSLAPRAFAYAALAVKALAQAGSHAHMTIAARGLHPTF
jgi:hypothetical protein